ncbi:MAG TPA: DUF4232 domain-containing protein [Streptosporangiaceae bacterium]
MTRWRAIVAGAVTGGAVAIAGCASPGPGSAASSRSPQGSHPTEISPPAGSPGSGAAGPGASATAYLTISHSVPFTGDVVPVTVQASAGTGGTHWERLSSATVNFGDGASATVGGRCTGASLPPASAGLVIRHIYQRAGLVSPQLTTAAVCGQSGRPDLGPGPSLRVLPAAPAASAEWPQCGPRQIGITAAGTGAALGHVGVLFTLRNTSSASCRLQGYPGMLLLGGNGQALPTTVVRVVSGAYLIPAVVPHRVALQPGALASFDLQYGDNPVGVQASEPYAQACPSAASAEVTLPNATGHSVVPVSMAPCGGQVLVSPVVPGSQWLLQ